MKKGVVVLVSVLAAAAVYVVWTQVGLDVYKVKVDSLQTGNIKISLDLTGTVQPDSELDIASASGRVSKIYVQEGDTVQAGDQLFSYDTTEAASQLASAQTELQALEAKQAKQETQTAYQNMDTSLSQYAQNAVSLAQTSGYELYHYNNAITNTIAQALSSRLLASVDGDIQSLIQSYLPEIKEALSSGVTMDSGDSGSLATVDQSASLAEQIQAARQNVDTLEDKVKSMQVDSTIAGRVLEVDIKEGETVSAGAAAMVVADTSRMNVYATVSGKDVKSLATGMDAVLTSADGNDTYPAKIKRIGQKILASGTDTGENMTDVVVTPTGRLDELPGSTIDLEVVISQKKNVPILSLDCFAPDGSVFVVDGQNIARKRTVEKGLQDDYNAEITSGLKAGERVVLNPGSIKDGQKVSIVDQSE